MACVTVVIPTHNRACYLPVAIKSVLEQTFQDFEIVVIDDASTDGTPEAVRAFGDPRIRYLRFEENRGAAAARNEGIEHSTCEYIAFLDDDDEWLPQKLRLQIERMEASPATVGMVYTGYLAVERATEEIFDVRRPTKRGDLAGDLLRDNWVSSTSSVLIRRECLRKVGPFDESLPSFQDYDLWIRISKQFHVECISQPLFKFYCHENRIWTNLDALARGMDMMLAKYGGSRVVRKQFSYRYLYLGVRYCEAGQNQNARQAFRKAISLHPLEARHYFNLCLSLAGSRYFCRVREAKERVLSPLRAQLARFSW